MKKKVSIAVWSCARLTSERCPKKMIKNFCGTSLTDIFLKKMQKLQKMGVNVFFGGYDKIFETKCKKKIVPETVLKLTSSSLKSAGLSRQKITYLKNIAKSFKNKSFNIRDLKKMDDNLAIDYITKLKGLGIWSAQMFLMFNLNRPDIFPTKDIGLIRAISKNYKTSYPPSEKFLNRISKKHSGYRTVFTWYMWRSIDPVDVEY